MKKKHIREYLESKKYRCTSSGPTRLLMLYLRYQRGLLSYDQLPEHELKSFMVRRGLTLAPVQKHNTDVLKAQLEQADEAPFDRFPELPTEIHCQIFERYFDSYDGSSVERSPIGRQPPITRVSRDVRAAALPLFYSRSCFLLQALAYPGGWYDRASTDFLRNVPSHHFARIRHIRLHLLFYKSRRVLIDIDFDDSDCSLRVLGLQEFCRLSPDDHMLVIQYSNELLMQERHAYVRSIRPHDGDDKLVKVLLLREKLWETLKTVLLPLV